MPQEILICPPTLGHAVDCLQRVFQKQWDEMVGLKMTEDTFLATTHHGFGRELRNEWNLWGARSEASVTLRAHFLSFGIWHADDMSSIILTCFYRRMNGKPWLANEQAEHYKAFWKKSGQKPDLRERVS